jgi:hypothetical protein
MNKNILRLCAAVVLIVEPVYLIVLFHSSLFQMWNILVTIYILLAIVTAVGLLTRKDWPLVLLWISIIFVFLTTTAITGGLPGNFMPGDLSWFVNLIIAIFLTIEWKKMRV